MSSEMDLDVMEMVQEQKEREAASGEPIGLDPEGRALAETKRFSLDIPEYEVKNDPLR